MHSPSFSFLHFSLAATGIFFLMTTLADEGGTGGKTNANIGCPRGMGGVWLKIIRTTQPLNITKVIGFY